MVIFGWVVLFLVACYATFCFAAGNLVSLGFSGKVMEWIPNLLILILSATLWYFVYTEFPFSVSIK